MLGCGWWPGYALLPATEYGWMAGLSYLALVRPLAEEEAAFVVPRPIWLLEWKVES